MDTGISSVEQELIMEIFCVLEADGGVLVLVRSERLEYVFVE